MHPFPEGWPCRARSIALPSVGAPATQPTLFGH
jgi:hypothetical protein